MLNIIYFLFTLVIILLYYVSNCTTSITSFFFFSEAGWILCFTMSTLLGLIYDDNTLFSFLLIILLITAMEVGLLALFFKIFFYTK